MHFSTNLFCSLATAAAALVLIFGSVTANGTPLPQDPAQSDPDTDYSYETEYYDSAETECPEDQFWHIRGRRCVPFECPRANWLRNKQTGMCLYTRHEVVDDDTGRKLVKFTRDGFKSRTVLRPWAVRIGSRARYTQSRWAHSTQRKRVQLDDGMSNPIRSIGLIG